MVCIIFKIEFGEDDKDNILCILLLNLYLIISKDMIYVLRIVVILYILISYIRK